MWLVQVSWYPYSFWRTEGWMQNSLCDFRQLSPSSIWCMKSCSSPRLQYEWVVFLTPFCCACFNVKCCQTETRPGSQCRFETLTVNFCQTNLLGSGVMWMCLMQLPAAEVTTQIFGKPSGFQKSPKNWNATKTLVSTKMCTRSSYDSSLVFG